MAKKGKDEGSRRFDGKLRQVIDTSIAHALSHPFRGHILATLGDRIASPNEIARELGIESRDLNYHIKVLLGVNMIKLVRTEKRRGAKEHFYDLCQPLVFIDDEAWRQIPDPIKTSISGSLLQATVEDAVEALQTGTFNARNSHHSRTRLFLSERGWSEITKVMEGALEKVLEIREKSAEDLDRNGGAGIPAEVVMMGFETAAGRRAAEDGAVEGEEDAVAEDAED